MINARITGLGQWIPAEIRYNRAWPSDFGLKSKKSGNRELVDVENISTCIEDEITLRYMNSEADDPFLGTTQRPIASPDISPPEVSSYAAGEAIRNAGISPEEIDAVFSWDAVPEYIAPTSASRIAYLIGAKKAWACGIDSACVSIIHQIEMASCMIRSGTAKHVLITQSHLMSRVMRMMHPASPVTGDLATAAVISADTGTERGIMRMASMSFGENYHSVIWTRGKNSAPWYRKGEDFFLGSGDPKRTKDLVRSTIRFASESVKESLQLNGCSPDNLNAMISVQPRKWVPGAIVEALGLNIPAPTTFDRFCHVGGCGIVANLIKAGEEGLLFKGSQTALYAQGAGFTRAAILVEW